MQIQVGIITISDRASAGDYDDLGGPALKQVAQKIGWHVLAEAIVPDDVTRIQETIRSFATQGCGLILTTGGTGIGGRDLTPEAIRAMEKRTQLCSAISETANVCDLTGKLAGKPKAGGSRFSPAKNRRFGRHSVKRSIHFDGREMTRIKFEPVRLRQIIRIKHTAPVVEAPCARADTNLLLISEIQMDLKINRFCS